jgi:uncharacterized protein with ParB-like and HNH nuclease domain
MMNPAEVPSLLVAADPDIFDDPVNERLLEDEDSIEEDLRYEISSYGADYDVDGLVKRLRSGDAKIPDFQRGYVWPIKQASRFIESLLLGLPVPGIFLSTEPETKKLLVIDGHQRLTTLLAFYDGIFPTSKKEFSLTDVQPSLLGKSFKTLGDEHRRILDNAIIHATVVKQTDPQDGGSGIYKIFERLNSSGVLLSPQEIRTAIYGGRLAKLLFHLNEDKKWRELFGPTNRRMRDQELILRFLAFSMSAQEYKRPMKSFLNDFMNKNRNLGDDLAHHLSRSFTQAVGLIFDVVGPKAFKPVSSFNAAVFDAILPALSKRLDKAPISQHSELSKAYSELLQNKDFQQWTSRSTADDETVKKRLELAEAAFASVR